MREFLTSLVLIGLVLGVGGCLDTWDRNKAIEARVTTKEEAFQKANPGVETTQLQRAQWAEEAGKEVDAEHAAMRAQAKKEAGEAAAQAVGDAATGKYPAAVSGLFLAALLFLGLKKPKGGTA